MEVSAGIVIGQGSSKDCVSMDIDSLLHVEVRGMCAIMLTD